jgi:2-amino-4-hydroxy-6-hydroxymethyldihydropteridine diphosphokinase
MTEFCHALVALGGNLPVEGKPPEHTLRAAIASLAARGLSVIAQSRLFRTPCFPKGAGPDYVNAAVVVSVAPGMSATEVLQQLHDIEARFGRTRATRWGGRTLDLDLLAFGDLVLPDRDTQTWWRDLAPDEQARQSPPDLVLPHPRLQDRAFVLVPLAEVAPDWVHPVLHRSVMQMLAALSEQDRTEVRPFA